MYHIEQINVNNQTWSIIYLERKNLKVAFMNYGAAIYQLNVPDSNGLFENIVIGYKDMDSYWMNKRHVNATIGPTAGRIKDATFELDGVTYQLDKNFEDKHNLHGGSAALSYTLFDYTVYHQDSYDQVVFTATQENGQYPGVQHYQISYRVYDSEIEIAFHASTNRKSLVNLTNHAYFNLSGNLKRNIFDQVLMLNATKKMKLNDEMIPYAVEDISNTKYDYRIPRRVFDQELLEIDDPYILDEVDYNIPQASLMDHVSKRRLDVYTTYPCIVCYTDNFPMTYELMHCAKNERYMGICFETQNPPNGLYVEGMEQSILDPNMTYSHKTRFVFSIMS